MSVLCLARDMGGPSVCCLIIDRDVMGGGDGTRIQGMGALFLLAVVPAG